MAEFIYRYCVLPGRDKGGVLFQGKFRGLSDPNCCIRSVGDSAVAERPCGEGGEFTDPLDAPEAEERRGVHSLSPETVGRAAVDHLELPIEQSERIAAGEDRKRKRWQPTRVGEDNVTKIVDMFQSFVYSPPSLITKQPCWLANKVTRFIHRSHPEYKQAEDIWKTTISNWGYEDFKTFYSRERAYRWCQLNDQPYYHTLDASMGIFEDWLTDQLSRNNLEVPKPSGGTMQIKVSCKECLQWFVDVLFRRLPKLNCITIWGPHCAGKTYVEKALSTPFLNIGYLENWNKFINSGFPFMDCVNRRVIVWNEAQVTGDNSQREDLKKLFEGAPMSVNVKNQEHAYVSRTPIIVTTNNRIYDGDPVFASRRIILPVSASSILTGTAFCPGQLQLHPLTLFGLIKKYSLQTDIEPCAVFVPEKLEIQKFDIYTNALFNTVGISVIADWAEI